MMCYFYYYGNHGNNYYNADAHLSSQPTGIPSHVYSEGQVEERLRSLPPNSVGDIDLQLPSVGGVFMPQTTTGSLHIDAVSKPY